MRPRGRAAAGALLAAVLAVAGRVGGEELATALPRPDLARVDPAVREQLSDARGSLDTLLARGAEPAALAAALGEMGRLYLAYDFLGPAAACLARARELAPAEPRAAYLLGYAHERNGATEEAIAAYEGARGLAPGNAALAVRLADLYLAIGRYGEAEPVYRAAYAADSDCLTALYGLGEVALRQGDAAAAAGRFRQILAAHPEASQVRYSLGLALRRLGRTEEARAELEQVDFEQLALGRWEGCSDPVLAALGELATGSTVHLLRGVRAGVEGRRDVELAEYRAAVAANPRDAVARKSLGAALYERGDLPGAAAELGEAVRLDPDDPAYRYALGRILLGQGDTAAAAEHFRAAVELHPRYVEPRLRLAAIDLQNGRFAEALEHARAVLSVDPANREAHLQRALSLMRLGRRDEAVAELGHLLDDFPPDAPADRLQLATLLMTLGDGERAERHLGELARDPATPAAVRARALLFAGQLHQARGDAAGAVERFRAALALDPGLTEAQQALDRALGGPSGG